MDKAYETARNQPANSAATGALCKLLDAHDQFDAAAQCYARAQALDPKTFDWPYHLGVIRASQSRYDESAAALGTALRVRYYSPAAVRLADALREAGHTDEASSLYRKLTAEEPGNAAAWYGLGRADEADGDKTSAEQCYRRAVEIYSRYGAASYALALLYQRQGKADLAKPYFQVAEEHKTEVPPVDDPIRAAIRPLAGGTNEMLRRAAAFERAGQISEAIRENAAAVAKDPQLLQAHVNLISLYGRSGRVREAEQEYTTAMSLPGSKADAEYNYGVLLFQQKRLREAEQAFRNALAANPQHAQAHHNLGFVLEQQGRLDDALGEYRAAIASQSDYRLAHFHAGRLLASQRKYAAAIDHLSRTVEPVDDSTPGYMYALSATYARAGQMQQALTYGQRAREEAKARGQTELLASIDNAMREMKATGRQ